MKSTAVSFLKSSRFRIRMNLREMHKVTEYRGGCIYKTRSLGYIICTPEYAQNLLTCSVFAGPVSTSVSRRIDC